MLQERHRIILREVVRCYLETGEPVGSKYLSESGVLGLGAASIRRLMCELELAGMLYAPHTSAGRVPTDEGWRFFVDHLMVVDVTSSDRLNSHLSEELMGLFSTSDLLQKASVELANQTHLAGVVAFRNSPFSLIESVRFLPVDEWRIAAVIVSQSGRLVQKILRRPEGLSDNKLSEFSQRITDVLHESNLSELKGRVMSEMDLVHSQLKGLLQQMASFNWLDEVSTPDVIVSGQGYLLEIPELNMLQTIRSLLSVFEDKQVLLSLIDQIQDVLERPTALIGSEHELKDMNDVAFVFSSFGRDGHVMGTLGVIGSKRMAYNSIFPIVNSTAQCVSSALEGCLD